MTLETLLCALTVAGFAFGLGFLAGRAQRRTVVQQTRIELRDGDLPVIPLTRLPKVKEFQR